MDQQTPHTQATANVKLQHTVVMLMPENDLKTWLSSAKSLLELSPDEREVALNQISVNHTQQGINTSSSSGLIGFLKDAFTFPENLNNAILAKESPDCDKACAHAHRDEVIAEMSAQSFNIVLGIFSPATKLKLFGSASLVEGTLLGEGKDAVVFALKGDADWVIKVLKFGGAERAEMLVHYINQLAADARLKIPQVIDLQDGRILQPFVHGTPKANQLWGEHVLTSQETAKELTSIARQNLGIKEGQSFINHPKLKIGVDPSFENFRFSETGAYQGWIDPIYELLDHSLKR
ncbi:MAG: hypothetical protein CVU29_02390 [Betaproteobacteria bacterium HGW-Betaproteobacteria-22]|nr:MAG: hypothetical protein CVU29_02390 [Betaproteobacteria bacterium HGW-Betaproteobacteria-22]